MIFSTVLGLAVAAIVIAVYIVIFSFIVWMAVDAARQDKFWWLVVIIGLPLLGAAIYYFTEKKHDYAKIKK